MIEAPLVAKSLMAKNKGPILRMSTRTMPGPISTYYKTHYDMFWPIMPLDSFGKIQALASYASRIAFLNRLTLLEKLNMFG